MLNLLTKLRLSLKIEDVFELVEGEGSMEGGRGFYVCESRSGMNAFHLKSRPI